MSKDELNDKIFAEMIKYAAMQNAEQNEFPDEEELAAQHTLSAEFQSKMDHLFVQLKKHEQMTKMKSLLLKIAAVFLAFCIISSITVMSVEALRVNILNFFSERSEKSTTITIGKEHDSMNEKQPLPVYIPEGYANVMFESVGKDYIALYEDKNGSKIVLQKLSGGSSIGIDSEDAYFEKLFVNGQTAEYYEKNHSGTLLYKFDGHIFMISAELKKNELLQIAESME